MDHNEELEELMKDHTGRDEMRKHCEAVAKKDAALRIAEKIVAIDF